MNRLIYLEDVGEWALFGRKPYLSYQSQIASDRFCAVQLLSPDSENPLYIFSVYLPSSDYPIEEFSDYISELQNAVSILQESGRVILTGDFNCHLQDPDRSQERARLMSDFIHQHNLYVASLDEEAEGPGYTFFSSNSNTTVDYIMIQSSLISDLKSCKIHHHHPLSLSDHLPISLTSNTSVKAHASNQPQPQGVNWSKAVERGDIQPYTSAVSSIVSALIFNSHQSASELNDKINRVCCAMLEASHEYLPSASHKKKKFIKDPELKSLCKQSRFAWEKWKNTGKPQKGPLADAKRSTKNHVRQFVSRSRARIERAEIQKRGELFKKNDRLRFKASKHPSSCKMLHVGGNTITDGQDIANHFMHSSLPLPLQIPPHHSSTLLTVASNVPQLEEKSFGHSDQVIDDDIDIEEIESALTMLKTNKSGGLDGLKAEHFKYGGEHLKLWLKNIFNRILVVGDTPQCMKDGLVIPVYKRQGKNPLLLNS